MDWTIPLEMIDAFAWLTIATLVLMVIGKTMRWASRRIRRPRP